MHDSGSCGDQATAASPSSTSSKQEFSNHSSQISTSESQSLSHQDVDFDCDRDLDRIRDLTANSTSVDNDLMSDGVPTIEDYEGIRLLARGQSGHSPNQEFYEIMAKLNV